MPEATTTIAPIVKTVKVSRPPEVAFRIFTAETSSWWPLDTHSVGGEKATGIRIDGRVGGLIEEIGIEGPMRIWGTITAWEPPSLFAYTFHPGTPVEEGGQVSVRFNATEGGTTVELTHAGWQNTETGHAKRANFDSGWDVVLDAYVAGANSQK